MRSLTGFVFLTAAICLSACGGTSANIAPVPPPATSPTPANTATVTPKNGEYPGKGIVTKIDERLGSVELKHDEIVGVMPAMQMEFRVDDKALLKGLAIGDKVDFTLKYKDGQETIVSITKTK